MFCKKIVPKNLAKFTEKHWNLFFSKVAGLNKDSGEQLYQKKDSNTGVFLWILLNFSERFLQNISVRVLVLRTKTGFQMF